MRSAALGERAAPGDLKGNSMGIEMSLQTTPTLAPTQVCRVPLSGGGFALIDADDAERVLRHKWHRGGTDRLYAATKISGTTLYLHRLVF